MLATQQIAINRILKYFGKDVWFTSKELFAKDGIPTASAVWNGLVKRGILEEIKHKKGNEYRLIADVSAREVEVKPKYNRLDTSRQAKKKRNDEFYTSYEDIEAELSHHHDFLKDKVILLNCNDLKYGNFLKYFKNNFDKIQPKEVIATSYGEDAKIYRLTKDGESYADLEGDGSFDSTEGLSLIDECDIVITNPPFSKFGDFYKILIEHEKDFMIISSWLAPSYVSVFPQIMSGRVKVTGYGAPLQYFVAGGEGYDETLPDSHNLQARICSTWLTTFPSAKKNPPLELLYSYDEKKYPKFDENDIIEVSQYATIPKDYDGLMAVPVTFLSVYCPNQFKIMGLNSLPTKAVNGCALHINGKEVFKRIIIKKFDKMKKL